MLAGSSFPLLPPTLTPHPNPEPVSERALFGTVTMMKLKHILLASSLCLTVPALSLVAQQPQAKKGKTVKFTLKNTSSHAMDLKSGDEAITLAPGQSREMKVAAGTRITNATSTETAQSGSVVTEVSDGLSGSTVNLR